MSSQDGGNKRSAEIQFNRFREVARKLGTERLAEELEASLARLVPPVPHRTVNGQPSEVRSASRQSQPTARWQPKPNGSSTAAEPFDNIRSGSAYMRVASSYGARAEGAGAGLSANDKRSPKPDQG